jgi:hypothetical protein
MRQLAVRCAAAEFANQNGDALHNSAPQTAIR